MTEGTTERLCQPISHFTPGCRDGTSAPSLLGCPWDQYQRISGDLAVLLGASGQLSQLGLRCLQTP